MRTRKLKKSFTLYNNNYNKYKHLFGGAKPSKRKKKKNKKKISSKKMVSKKTRKHRKKKSVSFSKDEEMGVVSCAVRNHKNKRELSFTCYTREELMSLKKVWNDYHEKYCNIHKKITGKTPKKIHSDFARELNREGGDERGWLKHPCMEKAFEKHGSKSLKDSLIFAPNAPSSWKNKPFTWLTNIDIRNVLKQHEAIDPTFKFLGPSPIDFDEKPYGDNECVTNELCNFDLNNFIRNGVRNIGIVFNLDKHDQSGSHWIGCFVDNNKKFIFFFDSYGNRPPRRVKKLIDRIREQSKEEMAKHSDTLPSGKPKTRYTYYENDKQHQYSNTECGVYCIHMIKQLLNGVDVYNYDNRIEDKKMKELRKKYFNI